MVGLYDYKYIKMLDISSNYPKKKTKTFQVVSKSSNDLLGYILWSGRWRQYVFETITDYPCIFSRGCNLDINHFIDNLMWEVKK